MGSADRPARGDASRLSVDHLFDATAPVESGQDLARDGVFDEGEVEELLIDLYALRRSDVA